MNIPINYVIPNASTEEIFKGTLSASFMEETFNEYRFAEYEK
jgi:hypothetical protein